MKIYKYSSVWKAMFNLHLDGIALSSPFIDFNDPYDCDVTISEESRKQTFKLMKDLDAFNFYLNAVAANRIKLSKSMKDELLNNYGNYVKKLRSTGKVTIEPFMQKLITLCTPKIKIKSKVKKEDFDDEIDKIFPGIVKNALISCFSKRNDSVAMWAHYASNHAGVCIEYEVDNPNFYEVVYGDKLPTFNLIDEVSVVLAENILQTSLLNNELNRKLNEPFYIKSKDWSYEEEVRCIYNARNLEDGIRPDPFINRYVLPLNSVKAIYLGIRCDLEDDEVKTLLFMANVRKIPVYTCQKSKDTFSIEKDKELDISEYKTPLSTNYADSVGLLFNQIDKNIKNGDLLSALFACLFAIAHCSNVFEGNTKERFITFCDKYLSTKNNIGLPLNGIELFELKERLFSYGDTSFDIDEGNRRVTQIRIDLSKPHELLNFVVDGEIRNVNGNVRLNLNVFAFCENVKKALKTFENDYKDSLHKLPKFSFYNNREEMFYIQEGARAFIK